MSVYFTPWDTGNNMMTSASKLYEAAGTFDCISRGDLVAIKLHVGELGNPHYVPPFFVHMIADGVKAAGGKPFLTDSCTYYQGMRANACDHMQNAVMNGYGGMPFIVADGLRSENFRTVKTKGILNEIEVSGAIAEADAMIVVTHDKGHVLTGFGGAIKNIAMGCCPTAGKLRQHRTAGLTVDSEKCDGCGVCKQACELGLPEIIEGKAHNGSPLCMRCPMCSSLCPNKAIELHDLDNVSRALASAAYGVLSTFKKDKVSYVSFAKDISEYCDCLPGPGKIVMDDIGIFASDSAVSVDAAFLNMADYKIFDRAYDTDCFLQVNEAKKLGIKGELKPKVETVE